MADLIIVLWRDIPAQVIVRIGRKTEKRELPEVFIQSIDRAAMKAGLKDSDAYLNEWRRADPVKVGDDLAVEADRAVADLVQRYPKERLIALGDNGGRDV
jgi:ribosomal protein L20